VPVRLSRAVEPGDGSLSLYRFRGRRNNPPAAVGVAFCRQAGEAFISANVSATQSAMNVLT
jgi:hypothetical protein